ncbi:MAG TPA: PKD domain-containing protein [Chitinophaga sp.]|uniref:PKD domain-containing protein n=1 Tax=Chitinophaga sp. TaxID=1869181 RepID=UPI002C6AD711|nr:PKD domain-containing protein [Chitinophaga sp.]HVI46625.1 PKD domain-containing protein [Chitinophaga sp.]
MTNARKGTYAMKNLLYVLRKAGRHLFGCLLILFVPAIAFTQNVTVTANKTSDCPPFPVQFNATLDNGYTSYVWDFGVGATINNTLSPSKIFQVPGVYHVTLTVNYPGGPVRKGVDITVYNKPTVAFTANPASGCIPLNVSFTDKSTPGDGTIQDITWDFADGGGTTGPTPTHQFTQAGTYNVVSIVTNSFGCKSNSEPFPVKVTEPPLPSFTADRTQSCTVPLAVRFFNTTVNNTIDPVTYKWDYGDGTSGTDDTHTYTAVGKYTVTLTTMIGNCSRPLVKKDFVVIQPLQPSFTATNACSGQATILKNTTTPVPDVATWIFPDGSTVNTLDANKVFPLPGDYNVTLRVSLGGCSNEIQQTFHINPSPQINPVADPLSGCKIPFTVNFKAQSQNADKWIWNFGDGTPTSSDENPVHTYTAEGTYVPALVASNANGCMTGITLPAPVIIKKPVLEISPSAIEGCIPLTVDFDSKLNVTDPIVSYQWDFGDGSTANTAKPQHIFTTQGTYTVTLNVVTAGGCTAQANSIVRTGIKSVVDFDATPRKSCAFDVVQFKNLSVPHGESWQWVWPQDNSSSAEENPGHQFSVIGIHNVTLIVTNNGCRSQLTKPAFIQILPPVARFSTVPDCDNPYHRKFKDESDFGPDPSVSKSWKWDFGEPGATSTDQHPDYVYKTTGTKTVTLTIDNGICQYIIKHDVNIIDEKPVIHSSVPWICVGKTATFTADPLNAANIDEYYWDWGDGTAQQLGANANPTNSISHLYTRTGIFTITLTITDKNGCVRKSPPVTLAVHGPSPDFVYAGKKCKNEPITFTDKSTVDAGNQIAEWTWNFGDGTPPEKHTTLPAGTTHTYTNTNAYTVQLQAVDTFGCAVSAQKTINFENVKADFMTPVNISCLNAPFTFVSTSAGTVTDYQWSFGDNTTGTGAQPTKIYTAPGTYNVSLKITTADGCTDEITKANVLRVPDPKAAFSYPPDLDLCPPVKVQFTNQSKDFVSSHWDFGDNGTSTDNNPDIHIYTRPKTYQVTLTVFSEGGCSDKHTLPITIKGPDGKMKVTPTQGCVPLQASISATAIKTVKFMWDFDDGVVVENNAPTSPPHTYTQPGIYSPRVTLIDDEGCKVPALGNDKVIVDNIVAGFTADISQACGGGVVAFRNDTKGLAYDQLGQAYTSAWSFGIPGSPGNTSTTTDGRFTYQQPGTFNVDLQVTSYYGCTDKKTTTVVVPPQPEPGIAPVTPLCVNGTVQLSGSENKHLPDTKWSWTVGNDLYNMQTPPAITVKQDGNIPVSLIITNADGSCPGVAHANIVVHPAPQLAPSPLTTNVCRGSALQLSANTTPDVKVTWTNYNISDPASQSPKVTPYIDTVYRVLATNAFGCTNEGEVRLTVTQPFRVSSQDADICNGKTTQLQARGALTYKWMPAEGLNNPAIPNPVANPDRTINYQVIGYDNVGCFTDTAKVRVTVYPSPVVNPGPDITVPTGSVVPLPVKGSNDITSVTWTPQTGLSCFDCLAPTATPKNTTLYHVTVSNQYGCVSKANIAVNVVCSNSNVFIPNTFSPNGDGQNDIFYIRGRGLRTVRVFRVYNRLGQMMFERAGFPIDDLSYGWDGRFNGTLLNPDVFVYYAEVICDTGEFFTLKGNVTLIR